MDNIPRGVRRVTSVLGFLLLAALVWVVFTTVWLWRNQERVVFQPPSIPVEAPHPAKRVEYRAADGHALFGYVVTGSGREVATRRTLVIAFHGNAEVAAWSVPWASELSERAGVTVFIPELRGYDGIPGPPTYLSAASDARGALDYARSLQPERIVLFGHSLGTAIAAEAAVAMQPAAPAALVLQSPFTSARDMATRMLVPPIPGLWRRISRVHYDTRAIVASLDCPVHVSHGARDLNIPARMGREVHAAAKNPAALLIVENAGHNDVADVGGDRYWRWLVDAVTRSSAGAPRMSALVGGHRRS
jgi:uncharacterized protein